MSGRVAVATWHDLRRGRPWATNVVLFAIGFGLLLLARQFVAENDGFTMGFSGVSGWSVILYLAAVAVVLTQPVNRWTFWIVAGFGVACRLRPLFADPFLSSDIYRYVWDGVVQHAHVSPYRYVPGDAALTFLRQPNQEIFDNMNRRDYARTIYPPVAQMIYFASTWISPTVAMMKTTMLGFECVTVAALVALLKRMGRPREQALLYVWCPLLVWEIGDAGHVDAAVIAFMVLALLFRAKGQNWWTGIFLGLAVMTKFYPLILFPALWRRGDWKMPTALMSVVVVGYAMYASVGRLVFGFAGGYAHEEGMATGARYFLLQWVESMRDGVGGAFRLRVLPQGAAATAHGAAVYVAVCGLIFAAICWWAWRHATVESVESVVAPGQTPEFVKGCALLAFALMLLFSPHYPWYIAWLIPLIALVPNVAMMTYVVAFFYLFTTELADPGPKMFLLNKELYAVTAVAMVLHVVLRRWPVHRRLHPEYGIGERV